MKAISLFFLLGILSTHAGHPLADRNPQLGREAVAGYLARGAEALPELRDCLKHTDPLVRARAKEALGGITGHWGSEVDVLWRRSLKDATGQGKPILLLHLFGKLDEEFC